MFEVHLYSRDVDGFTEVFCRDHNGTDHMLTRWQYQQREVAPAHVDLVKIGRPLPSEVERDNPDPNGGGPEPGSNWSLSDLLARAATANGSELAGPDPSPVPDPEPAAPIPVPAPEVITTPATPEPRRISVTEIDVQGTPVKPAPPPPLDDAARRRGAKAHIRRLMAGFPFNSPNEQLRYEQALLAHNGNVQAIEDLRDEAGANGISVRQLAEHIIDARGLAARRMSRVKVLHDQALKQLDGAKGGEIEAVEEKAVADMTGEANAAPDR